MAEGDDLTGRAHDIVEQAAMDRARLEFLLALGHELRTPAGVIAGYTSLAREGEIELEEAMDVVDLKARELLALIEMILSGAEGAIEARSEWDARIQEALSHSARLRGQVEAATARARALARQHPRADSGAAGERRDQQARAARDRLAELAGVHPREVGAVSLEVALRLTAAARRPRQRARTAAG